MEIKKVSKTLIFTLILAIVLSVSLNSCIPISTSNMENEIAKLQSELKAKDEEIEKLKAELEARPSTAEASETKETSTEEESTSTTEGVALIEKNIGDEINLSSYMVKVNEVKEEQTIKAGFSELVKAKENAILVVIDMSITNTTNVDLDFFMPDQLFRLVDDKQRQFTSYEESIGVEYNKLRYIIGRKLSPSIEERGVLIYEIPKDASSYSLLANEEGMKEIYKVILK